MCWRNKLSNRNILIFLLFSIFLVLRLFVSSNAIFLTSDNLKFLELSKNFPYHTLANDQLYLQHGIFYPYTIHLFNLIFSEDYVASILVSLVSASLAFFILYKLFMLLTKNFSVTFMALIFYTLSTELIISSYRPVREQFVSMLIFSAIYFYTKGIKFEDKKSILASSFLAGILSITSDHAIFLLPAFALSYLFFNSKKLDFKKLIFPNIGYALIPVLVIFVMYGSWLGVKAYQYSANEYYPAGIEGTPIKTGNFGILQLINPTSLEDYEPEAGLQGPVLISRLKNFAYNFGYMLNMEPFSIPRGVNLATYKMLLSPIHIFYALFIYLPLGILTIASFLFILKKIWQEKKIYNNAILYVLILFLIFIFPITQKVSSPRYIYFAYPFLYLVLGYGAIESYGRLKLIREHKQIFASIATAFFILLLFAWVYNHNYIVLLNEKAVSAQNTGNFINANLPAGAGIMAQPGYSYKIIYLTDNRVIGLPSNPDRLEFFINYYNISYIVFGRYYSWDKYHYSIDSVKFIQENPDRFRLIATIPEDYSKFYSEENPVSTDEVYIYEVLRT
jgi:hypothetical protein